MDRGEHVKAMENYDKSIELNPNYAEGIDLGKLKRHEEAITCFDKAIEIKSTDEEAWNNKGVYLERLGHKDEAEHCFQKAKKLGYKES